MYICIQMCVCVYMYYICITYILLYILSYYCYMLLHILLSIYIYSDIMKTIQYTHPLHHHNGFVETCQLWTASGQLHIFLVVEPSEFSPSTRLGA